MFPEPSSAADISRSATVANLAGRSIPRLVVYVKPELAAKPLGWTSTVDYYIRPYSPARADLPGRVWSPARSYAGHRGTTSVASVSMDGLRAQVKRNGRE